MIERRVTVINRLGLHARAAARLVRTASAYRSAVRIERADGSAAAEDAKSILSVLMLAAARGTELRATAEGIDEQEALDAVCALISSGFGEMEG
ncbi:MAG TPA: HPr family phosphocarrier protein [Pyrinomonadaceae bacterium]|jgi:phosphotransferase system HPr (HPr) family protein|nr:HPr family phosphocarrier protein [Pyrinomonadaceae bacterium]